MELRDMICKIHKMKRTRMNSLSRYASRQIRNAWESDSACLPTKICRSVVDTTREHFRNLKES